MLLPDSRVDLERTGRLVQAAYERKLRGTFHRAFDAVQNPSQALEELINLGVARLLTSGTPWGSGRGLVDGISLVNDLLDQAAGRIELVLGGGVVASRIGAVLAQLHPGRYSIHAYSGVLRNGLVDRTLVQQLGAVIAS